MLIINKVLEIIFFRSRKKQNNSPKFEIFEGKTIFSLSTKKKKKQTYSQSEIIAKKK